MSRSSVLVNKLRTNQLGMTIVEMSVATIIIAGMMSSIFLIFTNYYGEAIRNDISAQLTTGAQGVLRKMSEEIRLGSQFRDTNQNVDEDAPAGGWFASDPDVLFIVATPTIDTSNNFLFNADTGVNFRTEYIYFVEDNVLYRRALVHPTAIANNSRERTSCSNPAAYSSCYSTDQVITEDYSGSTVNYFDQNDVSTPTPSQARSVEVNLQLSRNTFGGAVTIDNKLRMTLRNING